MQVKMEGEEESTGKKRALVDVPQERGNAIKSQHLSMVECDGLWLESGMALGVCVQENAGGAFTGLVLKKFVVDEHLLKVQLLMEAIRLEQ